MSNIKTGNPVVLKNHVGLPDELYTGMKGWANSVANVEGKTYVFFLPDGGKEMFVMGSERLAVDEEALAEGADLNQDTLGKVQ